MAATNKKKAMAKKIDSKLIAAKQRHEVDYIKSKHGVPVSVTREVIKKLGTHSRKKVYAELRNMGYQIVTK